MDEHFPGSPGPDAPPPYLGGAAPGAGQVSERMQSLLSRAVEDQMAEQRQLQLLVNDIRASLSQLQEEVRQNAGAQSLEVVRAEVGGIGTEVRSSAAVIGERLEAVVRAVTASVQAVQSVSGQLERIHEQLAHQQQVMTSLPATVQRAVTEATSDTAVRDEMVALRAEIAQMRAATGELVQGVGSQVADLRESHRAGTEGLARQLTAHVDTAVLALVEALLRRRAPGSITSAPAQVAEPVASLTGAPAAAPYTGGAADDAEEVPGAQSISGDDLGHDPAASAESAATADSFENDAEQAQTLAADAYDDVAAGLADQHEDVPPTAADPTAAEAVDLLTAVAPTTGDSSSWRPSDIDEDTDEDDAADRAEATAFAADLETAGGDLDDGDDDEAGAAEPAADVTDDDADADAAHLDDDDDALRWSVADDRPQAAFTMGRGWDAGRERPVPGAEPSTEDEESAERPERRRPWWRPGG